MANRLRWMAAAAFAAAALAAGAARAAKEKPKKVSELLREANTLMSRAQDTYVNGESGDAIALYKKALEEIRKVERENPGRAGTPEFAPVRFRRALCETEIDRILLEEANANARTLTVSDTAGLEKKRAERQKEAKEKNRPDAAVALSSKRSDGSPSTGGEEKKPAGDNGAGGDAGAADGKADGKPADIGGELEFAKDMLSIDRLREARQSLLKILKSDPEHREGRFLMAVLQLREGRPADASVVLDDLLEDCGSDEAALLLAAGASFASGGYSKAMGFLDKAMRANPKRPDGYYDMAWLLLEMNPKDLDGPEMYYRQAVKLGGPRDRDMERRLGIKAK